MASKVLHPVLKSVETLAAVQAQTTTNTHYGKQSSPPSSPGGETLAAVQVQTTTNTHYGKQSSPPSSQEWTLAAVQAQTTTNTHYGKQSSPPSSQEWRSSYRSTGTNNYQHTLRQVKFYAQFSRVEKLLQQNGYKQPPTHIMASRVLRPVLKSGEALAAVQVQTTTNTHYGKHSSPPSSEEWRSSCSSTGTNNHQHTLRHVKFYAQFSRVEKLLQQYRYKQPPTHIMASRSSPPSSKEGRSSCSSTGTNNHQHTLWHWQV